MTMYIERPFSVRIKYICKLNTFVKVHKNLTSKEQKRKRHL